MQNLNDLREKIDKIDAAIIKKIALRQRLSKKIGLLKASQRKPVRDLRREKQQQRLYQQLCSQYEIEFELVKKIFTQIIAHSRGLQKHDR